MLRTDHHEQDKPSREKELEDQGEAGILRQAMETGVADFHKREESPRGRGRTVLWGSAEDCVKVRETK